MIWLVLIITLALVVAWPVLRERQRSPMDAAARKNAPGQFVTLSQGVTHYQWIGPVGGPIAVCVHGLTTPSYAWHGLAQGLTALGYRVLVYDLYGRGYSDRPAGLQTREFFLRQLDDLLADQHVEDDITLLGYSMGGAISAIWAAAHPQRTRQLILLTPAGMGANADAVTRFIVRTQIVGDWLMLAVFPSQLRKRTEAERALPSSVDRIVDRQQAELRFRGYIPGVLSSIRGLLDGDLQDEHRALHRANVPVLAFWGREDDLIPLTAMGQLIEWNPNCRQAVIDGAGHGLPYTHTEKVLDVLRDTRVKFQSSGACHTSSKGQGT